MHKIVTALFQVLVFVTAGAMAASTAHADYTWFSYNGKEYAITQNYNTWLGAENEAISQGGHLATLTDATQVQWILDTFPNIYAQGTLVDDNGVKDWGGAIFWIGLHNTNINGDFTHTNDWVWSSGITNTYWQGITLQLWNWNDDPSIPLGDPSDYRGPVNQYAYFHTIPHQGFGTINDQAITGNIVFGLIERNAAPVPLPSALLLLGPGLAGLAVIRRRFGK
jgi:hypothetical protein